jgi:hypothetical protein
VTTNRTYIVKLPGTGAIDIMPEGPVGSRSAPVQAEDGTAPPAGWNGGDGAYYEWRGRTLRFEKRAAVGAAGGFVPRLRLGWNLSLYRFQAAVAASYRTPGVIVSQSLIDTIAGGLIANTTIADPSYGPVIRLTTSAELADQIWVVHFSVAAEQDEDRAPAQQ